jgi:hypothetical protein
MATKNNRRKTYSNAKDGGTCVDLTRVCAYTFTFKPGKNPVYFVDFHMDSGTIFSVKMTDEDKIELDKIWAYWRDE